MKWITLGAVLAIGAVATATLPESVPHRKGKVKAPMSKAKANLEEKVQRKEEAKDGRKEDRAGGWRKVMAGKEAKVKARAFKENAGLAERWGIVQMNAGM